MDFSGFERDTWHPRSVALHKEAVERISQQKVESETGFRCSVLLHLPYFNSNRMLVANPMHNLYLGSAKHVLKAIWNDKQILSSDDFETIQRRVDQCSVPADIGRIPFKILSEFSSFTADQFKNWVIYFSLIALRGMLSEQHLEYWRHFVLACRLLSQYELSRDEIIIADALLLKFCRRTECMYGKAIITPNMHLHCHLKECIMDYGPLHAFWCFPFERYNGLLGQLPNNNKTIEIQLMNRFINDSTLITLPLPTLFNSDLAKHIPMGSKAVGSLSEDTVNCTGIDVADYNSNMQFSFPKCFTRGLSENEEMKELKMMYSKLYESDVFVHSLQYNNLQLVKYCILKFANHLFSYMVIYF